MHMHIVFGKQNDPAAIAVLRRVGLDAGGFGQIGGLRVFDIGIEPLLVAANANLSAPACARCLDNRVVHQADTLAQHVDLPALAAGIVGRYRGVLLDIVAFGNKVNAAGLVDGDGIGADMPRVTDGAGENTDGAAVADQLAEVDRLVFRRLHFKLDGFAAHGRNRHALAGGQQQVALLDIDHAFVFDRGRHQHHFTAVAGVDETLVENLGIVLQIGKMQMPGEKILVGKIESGSNQPGGIDDGVAAKDDAVGVDQKNLAVGAQLAKNGGRVLPANAVEHGAGSRRLNKAGEFVAADIEILPLDDGVARIGDFQRVRDTCIELRAAMHHLRGGGIRIGAGNARPGHRNRG